MMRVKKRFERRVKKAGSCWVWTSLRGVPLPRERYGRFYYGGQLRFAHRAAWELYVGEIPGGKNVMHICDRPHCVNPEHLRLGTHAENTWDAIAKGRFDPMHAARVSMAQAKITPAKLERLWELHAEGKSQREIAMVLGVSQPAVNYVIRGKTHRT